MKPDELRAPGTDDDGTPKQWCDLTPGCLLPPHERGKPPCITEGPHGERRSPEAGILPGSVNHWDNYPVSFGYLRIADPAVSPSFARGCLLGGAFVGTIALLIIAALRLGG